jgi:hypothetical protein
MASVADRGRGPGHARFVMRPRRWYADEVAPPRRKHYKLTLQHWRYRSLSASPYVIEKPTNEPSQLVFRGKKKRAKL